jgi:hypothetical protein
MRLQHPAPSSITAFLFVLNTAIACEFADPIRPSTVIMTNTVYDLYAESFPANSTNRHLAVRQISGHNQQMALSPEQREYAIQAAVELLRHPKRDHLLDILSERLAHGDYQDPGEAAIDRIVMSIAKTIDEDLKG